MIFRADGNGAGGAFNATKFLSELKIKNWFFSMKMWTQLNQPISTQDLDKPARLYECFISRQLLEIPSTHINIAVFK